MAEIGLRDVEKFFGANYVIRQAQPRDRRPASSWCCSGPRAAARPRRCAPSPGSRRSTPATSSSTASRCRTCTPGERDIAFVFQLFALYPHLTAFDNIAFPLRATGESRGRDRAQGADVAASLRIEPLLGKRPSALSGGDMQRVAIGRALVRRPKALLMDEPIGALDAKLREDMRAELKRLHIENGTTSVYVTHDQIEAMSARRPGRGDERRRPAAGRHAVARSTSDPVNLFVAQFVGLAGDEHRCRPRSAPRATRRGVAIGGGPASPSRASSRRGSARRCPPGTSSCSASAPRRCRWRARRAPGDAAGGGAPHRAARRLRHRRSQARRPAPQGAHPERLRARAGRGRSGPGSTRRRCISSTPPPATRWRWGSRMAEIGLHGVSKRFGGHQALDDLHADHRRRRVLRAARPDRRRQDHDAAPDRRAREARRRLGLASAARTPPTGASPSATWRWSSSTTRSTRATP